MEEYCKYRQGADEAQQEEVDAEESSRHRPPVGELVVYYLSGYEPSQEYACEHTSQGQEYLSSNEVEEIKKVHSTDTKEVPAAQRQRAEHADYSARNSHYHCSLLTGDVKFLKEERGAHLMERHQRCECRHGEKQVEKQRHYPAYYRHSTKCLIEDIGKGNEDKGWATVGIYTDGEGCWEYHKTSKNGNEGIYDRYLYCRLKQIGLAAEIGCVGTDTSHGNGQGVERLSQGTEEHALSHLREVWP